MVPSFWYQSCDNFREWLIPEWKDTLKIGIEWVIWSRDWAVEQELASMRELMMETRNERHNDRWKNKKACSRSSTKRVAIVWPLTKNPVSFGNLICHCSLEMTREVNCLVCNIILPIREFRKISWKLQWSVWTPKIRPYIGFSGLETRAPVQSWVDFTGELSGRFHYSQQGNGMLMALKQEGSLAE